MATNVSNLQARLALDDSEFARIMRQAVNQSKTAAKEMQSGFSGLGSSLAGALSFGVLAGFGRTLIDTASDIHDMSHELGISTDAYQQFGFAVAQSGGSQEAFNKALNAVIDKTQAALHGNEEAITSFNKLGISLASLRANAEHPDELFLKIVDAMSSATAGNNEYAAAAGILGSKVMLKLGESLKIGRDGFLELAKSADIASKSTVNLAEAAGDKLASLWQRIKIHALTTAVSNIEGIRDIVSGQPGRDDWTRSQATKPVTAAQLTGAGDKAEIGKFMAFANAHNVMTATGKKTAVDDLASKRIAEAQVKLLEEQIKERAEIQRIVSETAKIEDETRFAALNPEEKLATLIRERVSMLQVAAALEKDIFRTHEKDVVILRRGAAEKEKQIEALKREGYQSFFQTNAMDMRERAILKAQQASDGSDRRAMGGQSGRLLFGASALARRGGLHGGGLNTFGLTGDTMQSLARRNREAEEADKAKAEEEKKALGKPGVLDRLEAKWQ